MNTMTHLSTRAVLVTDLDNTLYNFVDYFAPCFRAMVHTLSRYLKEDEEALIAQFAEVYQAHGTVEYSFSVQELACVRNLAPEEITRVVELARIAFGQTRRKRLRLYPGVKETLNWFVKSGGILCALTNAPAYHAYSRLRYLGIESLFEVIGAWEGVVVPDSEASHTHIYERRLRHVDSKMRLSMRKDKSDAKPNPVMLREIVEALNVPAVRFYAVGDSLQRDLVPCTLFDMTTIWARYGRITDPKNQQTLDDITPWTKVEFAVHYKNSTFEPDHTIDSFPEIMEFLPFSFQRALFT